MSKVLVVVDYQNDFVDGILGFEDAVKLESSINDIVEETLLQGGYVVFTRDTHEKDYLRTREGKFLLVPHCIKGTEGHRLCGCLHYYEEEDISRVKVIDKPTFGSNELAGEILELCGEVPEEIEICGVVTDICVVSNAIILHAAFETASIKVLPELCASNNKEKEAAALLVLSGLGMVEQ